jgi:malonyl-CoA O-methyltransferase
MTIQDDYTRWAPRYDTDPNRTRDLDREATAQVLRDRRFGHTIEAGCGTGKNTVFLSDISDTVLALDFSPGMLARASERVRASNVTFQQADLGERWPSNDEGADLVSCNLVLEHLRDLGPVFREASRVLRPNGVLFVCELHPARQYGGSQARIDDPSGSSTQIEAFVHHLSDFASAARSAGLRIERLDEWWHEEDAGKTPRLISFVFEKGSAGTRLTS